MQRVFGPRFSTLLFTLSLLTVASAARADILIERVSSPVFYIDDANGDAYRSMYAGYRVTNGDEVAYPNLFVALEGFSPAANVTLAATEDGVESTGVLAPGASRVVYFYLTAAGAKATPESHTVSVYLTRPFANPLASSTYALTTESTITANSNKVAAVSYSPLEPALGGELTMTITGETGTIGLGRNFAYTPASRIDWPSNAYQLIGTRLELGTTAPVFDRLWVQPASTANQTYTITYVFRVACANEGTPISMLNHIDSGNNNKHNDPLLLPVAPVPPPTESPLVLSREPTWVNAEGEIQVLHTLRFANLGDEVLAFEDIWDQIVRTPTASDGTPATSSYVQWSTLLDGAPFPEPEVVGASLHWSGSFVLGPGEFTELSWVQAYPSTHGLHTHHAWGEVSSSTLGISCGGDDEYGARIDTTPSLTDYMPAVADVAIGVIAVEDDEVFAAEGVPLEIPFSELLANDGAVSPETFEIITPTSFRGGTVSFDPDTGIVTYSHAEPLPATVDTFVYEVCSLSQLLFCQRGTVTVTINQRPELELGLVVGAVGDTSTSFDVNTIFDDPEGQAIGSIEVLGLSGGSVAVDGDVLVFTPPDPLIPGVWTATLFVCDDGVPSACAETTVTFVHNDPPVVQSLLAAAGDGLLLAFGQAETTPLGVLLVSLGEVAIDDPSDGDTDGIGTIAVAGALSGPLGAEVTLDGGALCRVLPGGAVEVVAASAEVEATCYVRICEELPAGREAVCSVAAIDLRAVECATDADCEPPLVCDPDTFTCEPCLDDAEYPAVDTGCVIERPICEADWEIPTCVECQDTAPGNALDIGCTFETPICDTAAPGGPDCVQCLTNEDCEDGFVCDPENNTCVACLDTEPPGGIDFGCETILNACEGEGDDAGCVDCQSDPDCALGDVCDIEHRSCVDCLPTADLDDIDPGCDIALPQCITRADVYTCVECVRDADCDTTEFCELTDNVCLPRDIVDARADLYVTPAGVVLSVAAPGVLANDIVPAGAVASVALTGPLPSPTTAGVPTLSTAGALVFTPVAGFVGTVRFDYRLTTIAGGEDTATVTVIVNGTPTANDDAAETLEDTPVMVDVLANDTDPNTEEGGQPLTLTRIVSGTSHGTLSLAGGAVRYVPNPDFHGSDVFTYEACDPHGACDTAEVALTVTAVNDAPNARDDAGTTPEDTALLLDVLANDSDIDGDTLSLGAIVQQPAHGVAALAEGGGVLYTPAPDFHGFDRFTYTACDTASACTETWVLVTVTPLPDAPRAADDAVSTPRDTPIEIRVLANDVDPDGDDLQISRVLVAPGSGTASPTVFNSIWYVPSSGFVGEDRFVYEVCDPSGLCDTAAVTVRVGAGQATPVARRDVASTNAGVAVVIDVLANDNDADGDALTVTALTAPFDGTASIDGEGRVVYTPTLDGDGLVRFAYTACDPTGLCASAAIEMTVRPAANRAPIAVDDAAWTRVGVAVVVPVLANDVDPDGDAVSLVSVSAPRWGTAVARPDGTALYTPRPGWTGLDTFTVTVTDGRGATATSTTTVTVEDADNTAPVANPDTFDVTPGADLRLDVLANDSDADADALTIVAATTPSFGALALTDDGALRVSVAQDASGSATFTYTIADGRGGFDSAEVRLTVPAPLPLPEARDDWTSTHEDEAVVIVVTANDVDPEGGALAVTAVDAPRQGAAELLDDGTVLYTPGADWYGTDSFSYIVCSSDDRCASARVTVIVHPVDDAPLARDDVGATSQGMPVLLDVLANDSDADGDPLTLARISAAPLHGSASIVGGQLRYLPGAAFVGTDLLRYEACDPSGLCAEALVVVHVGAGNLAPVAAPDAATTPADEAIAIAVLDNDTDPDGDLLILSAVTAPLHGTTVIDGAAVVYTPDPAFFGTDRFAYTVCDDATPFACASASVVVTVTRAGNRAPIATGDLAATESGVPVAVPVLANDVDPDGDTLRVWAFSPPLHGVATVDRAGVLTYTPAVDFIGTERIMVTITDGRGGFATALLEVRVTAAPNATPLAADDEARVWPGTSETLAVLDNDSDADGDPLAIVFIFQPTQGTARLGDGGTIVYTADSDATGTDAFAYTITDGRGGFATASVLVTFPFGNTPPTAVDDFAMVLEEGGVLVIAIGNDFDADGQTIYISATSQPEHGEAILNDDGTLSYIPDPDYWGPDTFTYVLCDITKTCTTGQVTIDVRPVNDAPVAADDTAATAIDTSVTVPVLANDADIDSDVLTLTRITFEPVHGTATLDGDVVVYTPGAGFSGTDTFMYEVCDPSAACDRGRVTVIVGGDNRAPTPEDDFAETVSAELVAIAVLDNDSDPDGDPLQLVDVTPSGDGVVRVVDDVVFFTPYRRTSGLVELAYTVCDDGGLCAVAFVSIQVDPIDDTAPVALDDVVGTTKNEAVTVRVLFNDFDPDGDTLTLESVALPPHGVASIEADGTVLYSPETDFVGVVSFDYTIHDGRGRSATATISVFITATPNGPPVTAPDTYIVAGAGPMVLDVLANDSDPDGDTLRFAGITLPRGGTLRLGDDGQTLVFLPDPTWPFDETFRYNVTDGFGHSAHGDVTLVRPVPNRPPSGTDDTLSTLEDRALVANLLFNDLDPDGDPLELRRVNRAPAHGVATVVSPGVVRYVPRQNFSGRDDLSYMLCDPHDACTSIEVLVIVEPVPDAPDARDDHSATLPGVPVGVDVLRNDDDADGEVLTLTRVVVAPVSGVAALGEVASGAIGVVYTPAAGFTGSDLLVYEVCDPTALCDTATLFIEVASGAVRPVAVDDVATTAERVPVLVPVLDNDSHPEGAALTVALAGTPLHGTVAIVQGGLLYTPEVGFTGTDATWYTACDADRRCATARLVVTVTPGVNRPPQALDDFVSTPLDTPIIVDVTFNDLDPDADPVSVVAVGDPDHGRVIVDAVGRVVYTPAAGFSGRDQLFVTIGDGRGGRATSTLYVLVLDPPNTPPVATADAYDVAGTAPRTLDILANDRDGDLDPLTIIAIMQPSRGVATPDAESVAIVLTPAAGTTGMDSLRYRITDGRGGYSEADVSLRYPVPNQAPVAQGEFITTPEDTAVLVRVLLNDDEPDGDALILAAVHDPARGTVTRLDDGTVLYTPDADFHGEDAFGYTVCDPFGACCNAHVAITVTPVNDAPRAYDDAVTTGAGETVAIAVLANDIDPDLDALSVRRLLVAPPHGTAVIGEDGVIAYTPAEGETVARDSFVYEVCDAALECDSATVTIVIGGDNGGPSATPDAATVVSGVPTPIDVLANDTDPDDDALTLTRAGPSGQGRVVIADGAAVFTSNPGFVGVATFSYEACDPSGACAAALVTVTVTAGENLPPIALVDVAATAPGVPVVIDVLANDSDPDGDVLRVRSFEPPMHGTASVDANGLLTYTPNADFEGVESFRLMVTDGRGGFDDACVKVYVRAENRPPVAVDDLVTLRAGAIDIAVLANDSDPDGDDLVLVALTQPAGAIVNFEGEGVRFEADPAALGRPHVVTYVISDRRGGLGTADIILTPPPDNRAPVGVGDVATTFEDTAVLLDVLANDSDADGDPLTVSLGSARARFGEVEVLEDGSVLYTPRADRAGVDTFTYTLCDEAGACVEVPVRIDVLAAPDAPNATDDAFVVQAGPETELPVLDNDVDPDGDALVVGATEGGGDGVRVQDGALIATFAEAGVYVFTYDACDPSGLCATARVTVTVGGGNRAPVAADDTAETDAGLEVVIDVLANDSDADGDTLDIAAVLPPSHGDAIATDDGVVYRPDPGFIGLDRFVYTVCDGVGACDTAAVDVEVLGANRAPVAIDDVAATRSGVAVAIPLLANDVDPDGDPIEVVSFATPTHGDATVDGAGILTYTPGAGFIGTDIFQVVIRDELGLEARSLCVVHVRAVSNRVPVAGDDFFDVPEEIASTLPVLDNDMDPDGDALEVVVLTMPMHGIVRFSAAGLPVYTPALGYVGADRFTYVVTDGFGGRDEAVVELRVGDRDGDGLSDRIEETGTLTDPDNPDTDGDGLGDGVEVAGGDPAVYDPGMDTDPLDADTDDDGLGDGVEVDGRGPLEGVGATDPLDPDSDGDGLLDGVEVGVTEPVPGGMSEPGGIPFAGTDLERWQPDLDPRTLTDPLDDDSDDDGLLDGTEDADGNGRWDGIIGATGSAGSGETDPGLVDTDGDGIQDGTELGLVTPEGDDTDLAVFVPDADPTTTTDPRDLDTDDGSVFDGAEDVNANGRVDPGEIDPNFWFDDVPKMVQGGSEGCAGGSPRGGLLWALVAFGGVALVRTARRRARR